MREFYYKRDRPYALQMNTRAIDYPVLWDLRRMFALLAMELEAGPALVSTTGALYLDGLHGMGMSKARAYYRKYLPLLQREGLCEPGPLVNKVQTWRATGTKGAPRRGQRLAQVEADRLLRRYRHQYG